MPAAGKRQQVGLARPGLLLLSVLAGLGNCAHAQQGLTSSELLGRQLYRRGDPHAVVEVGDAKTKLDGTLFPCANCHGLRGEGRHEAGLTVPAISAQVLFADSPIRRRYDRQSLKRAITQGLGSNHRPLNRAMPRYALTNQQLTRLTAYLQRLGTDLDYDPGISRSEVSLGTLLPLSGALADTGRLLKATLESCIDDLNSRGPIYGRKLTLTALDSGANTGETLLALQNLLSEAKAFALVSAYIPLVTADMYRLIEQEQLPIIAPLSFSPSHDSLQSAQFFNFLPTYEDQLHALIQYWADKVASDRDASNSRLAILVSDNEVNRNLLPKISAYLERYPQVKLIKEIMLQPDHKEMDDALSKLANLQIDAVLFLGNAQEFKQVRPLLADIKNAPLLLGLLAMLGEDILAVQGFSTENMLIASPFSSAQEGSLDAFGAKLGRHAVKLLSPGLQKVACQALEFVGEGLKQAGKQLSRSAFIDGLKQANSLYMDIMPPLDFGKDSSQGIRGAYILTINSKSGSSYWSEWVTVR